MTESVRLAKRVAEAVPCSRREAEQYIEGGWILVDGQVIEESGFRVLPQQIVERLPQATLVPALPVTILLHKPVGMAIEIDAQLAPACIASENRIADDRSGIHFFEAASDWPEHDAWFGGILQRINGVYARLADQTQIDRGCIQNRAGIYR